jgi:hypothetical protein
MQSDKWSNKYVLHKVLQMYFDVDEVYHSMFVEC